MEKMLNRLERRLGRHYIPHLMQYLCFGMLGVFILNYLPLARSASGLLYFDRDRILNGEVWRLVTFVFLPPTGDMLFILLNLYFDYFIGTSLENSWGGARFNIYYFIGVLGNIAAGMLTGYATNTYLNISLLLAFSVLFPEERFMLFFVLPVRAKWFGIFAGALLIYQFIFASWAARASVLLSVLPFLLFFGPQALLQLRMDVRRLLRRLKQGR